MTTEIKHRQRSVRIHFYARRLRRRPIEPRDQGQTVAPLGRLKTGVIPDLNSSTAIL